MEDAHHSPPEPRRGIGCLLALMAMLAVVGVVGLGFSSLSGGMGGDMRIDEVVEDASMGATRKLVIIDVRGALMRGGGMSGGVTETTLAMLDRAAEDEAVAGVLIRVDSPGGSVTDADLIHHRIERLKRGKRKVVVQMGDLCASGCVYFAAAADEIWALPTTVTGSIGVIISNLEFGGLLERVGVIDDSITSGRNKQLLSPFKPLTIEQRALLQGIVDAMYTRFVDILAEGRGIEADSFREVADGRLLTADQALERKLIDGIDYPKAVLGRLKKMAGEDAYLVVRYTSDPGLAGLLQGHLGGRSAASPITELIVAPRPMYLYAPGALVEGLR